MHTCVCRGRKASADPLELPLWKVGSHPLGARNWTQVLCKNSKCSYLLSHLSSPERNLKRIVPGTQCHTNYGSKEQSVSNFPLRDYHEHLVSLGTGQLVITQHEKLFWFACVDCGISLNFCFVQVGVTTTKSTLKHQLIDSHIDKAVIFLAQELEQKNLVLCPRLWLHSLTINHRSELNRSLENIWPNSHFTESPKGAQEEKWLAHSNMAIAY